MFGTFTSECVEWGKNASNELYLSSAQIATGKMIFPFNNINVLQQLHSYNENIFPF